MSTAGVLVEIGVMVGWGVEVMGCAIVGKGVQDGTGVTEDDAFGSVCVVDGRLELDCVQLVETMMKRIKMDAQVLLWCICSYQMKINCLVKSPD